MSLSKLRTRFLISVLFCSLIYLLILAISFSNDCSDYAQSHKNARLIINPPQLSLEEKKRLSVSQNDRELKKTLSAIIQNQIEKIQHKTNCSQPNFLCGHYQDCGFGCQIHHRAACVMMSYVLNMPLIHDENDSGWSFSKKWTEVFRPMGSGCVPGQNTYSWTWERTIYSKMCSDSWANNLRLINTPADGEIRYPIRDGFSASEELASLVEKISEKPFVWWVGQFIKYTMRLSPNYEAIMHKSREQIGFKSPIVGAHIRRTDKVRESEESRHAIKEYFDAAEEYFRTEELKRRMKLQRRIFIASDDATVLPEARAEYPFWDIRGFESNITLRYQEERVDALHDILRDIEMLSECDFIVCGFSSNVCRLLLEMVHSDLDKPTERLKSLDGEYSVYLLQGHSIGNLFVNKISDKRTTSIL